MRIKIDIELETTEVPLDYRRYMLSNLKTAVKKEDEELYTDLFEKGNRMKLYTTAVYFKNSKITGEKIVFNGKLSYVIATPDVYMAMVFWNAYTEMSKGSFKLFNKKATITKLSVLEGTKGVINGNIALFKTASPIVAREHDRDTLKDRNYSIVDEENFKRVIKDNLKRKYRDYIGDNSMDGVIDSVNITWDNKAKKTVVRNYEIFIEATVGEIAIQAPSNILNFIHNAGLGSRTGMGFGCLSLINEMTV